MSNTPVQGSSSRAPFPLPLPEEFSRTSSTTNLSSTTSLRKSRLRKRSKSTLKRSTTPSQKLIFSVDDDINDRIDEDLSDAEADDTLSVVRSDRVYLEGYSDALKALYHRKTKSPLINPSTEPISDSPKKSPEEVAQLESTIAKDLQEAEESIRVLEEIVDSRRDSLKDNESEIAEYREEDADVSQRLDNDDDEARSLRSIDSVGSLNLRERQDAINSTHPFGIKIWKPSLYKKKRSVATRAEEDIHDFDPRKPTTTISWGVILTNLVWGFTTGLFIYLICLIGAAFVFVFSGFAIQRRSRPYVKLLLKLGRYWLFPFGKFVLINKDENYLEEDELYGRTINEFHQWRLQEEGRLFFAPPRRYTNSESKPLLKDDKGRPLRDAYASIDNAPNGVASSSTTGIQSPFTSNPRRSTGLSESSAISGDDDHGDDSELNDVKMRLFGRGSWSGGRLAFYIYFYILLQPILYLIGFFCWLGVFTIPMAKITNIISVHLRRHPLALDFEQEKEYYKRMEDPQKKKRKKHQRILLCTYRCCGFHYYKYTIDGTNIFFINLLAVVILVILDFYALKESLKLDIWLTDSTFIFCACLFSIIPLAYFIGQAVASISAQSSMGVGAAINAFFSTIVEIFLYCVALNQSKGKLVEGSMIGSILGGVLLLPGLSMCGGAVKRKTQRYNPRSAGVSSTMLLFAMLTMFAPSLFYQIYGAYEIKCKRCDIINDDSDCNKCRFIQPSFTLDALYYQVIKPFSLIVAAALFAAYVCGLFFTLRTHASLIWATNAHEAKKQEERFLRSPSVASMVTPLQLGSTAGLLPNKMSKLPPSALGARDSKQPSTLDLPRDRAPPNRGDVTPSPVQRRTSVPVKVEEDHHADLAEGGGGHDAPNWSRTKSTVILLSATLLYAIIAEILVNTVDSILIDFPINPKFLGLTVFALVPNTTEFLNAISFAIGGNVALSMEIGSAYALQVVLIQIPCLVLYSIYQNFTDVEQIFSLVFPRWDIIATLISIYLFTYVYAEGKSNYFKGVILCLIYFVVLIGFWFNDIIENLDDGYFAGPGIMRSG
ncbi:uncharacterized protein J8A68_002622 [[Candida] subhashii]|uniref:Uncharacterized protein n=1 Tax=[Candida] subhashii TaxID=561895 RepID=A0A8J5UIS2_9ASCO|nr:uncharacterized protein J8A68_002622 [[Candida] subhashii]KAG7663873.1 hypothetical protein J8A68_002622 [[Candida] subhashii]